MQIILYMYVGLTALALISFAVETVFDIFSSD